MSPTPRPGRSHPQRAVAAPVVEVKSLCCLRQRVPVLRAMSPLTPAEPESAVAMVTAPESVDVPTPLVTVTAPPTVFVPIPPLITTEPPAPVAPFASDPPSALPPVSMTDPPALSESSVSPAFRETVPPSPLSPRANIDRDITTSTACRGACGQIDRSEARSLFLSLFQSSMTLSPRSQKTTCRFPGEYHRSHRLSPRLQRR